MMPERRIDERELDRFLDDLVSGRSDERGYDLDSSIVQTIYAVRALAGAPLPGPWSERLDVTTQAEITRLSEEGPAEQRRPTIPADTDAAVRLARSDAPITMPGPGRTGALARIQRRFAPFATVALILLALVASFVAFGPGRPSRPEEVPAILPAISATPGTPERVTTETLLDTVVGDLPAGRNVVAVDRWRLQPSPSALTLPAHQGAVLTTVDTGEIAVTVAGRERRLVPGDALDVTNQEFSLRASGSAPATAYVVYVTPELSANRLWTSGDPLVHAHDAIISSSANDLQGGSGRIVFQRLTLPPGAAMPPQEANSRVWTQVGSGVLGLTLEGDHLPFRWTPGSERKFFQFGREPVPDLAPGTLMKMRNAGDEPLVLYRLELIPSEGRTAGTATPRPATPSG